MFVDSADLLLVMCDMYSIGNRCSWTSHFRFLDETWLNILKKPVSEFMQDRSDNSHGASAGKLLAIEEPTVAREVAGHQGTVQLVRAVEDRPGETFGRCKTASSVVPLKSATTSVISLGGTMSRPLTGPATMTGGWRTRDPHGTRSTLRMFSGKVLQVSCEEIERPKNIGRQGAMWGG